MALSTSSFKERSICVLALAALLTAGVAYLNNTYPDPNYAAKHARALYWQNKVFSQKDHSYNVVAAGDSRVYRGFDPQAFAPHLAAFNDAFSNGGHNAFTFRETERLLSDDPNAPRVIILGITPASLTPKAQTNGEYNDVFKKGPSGWDDAVYAWFRSMDSKRAKQVFLHKEIKPRNEVEDFKQDGWVRSDWLKRDTSAELETYRTNFDGNPVDPKITEALMRQVEDWRAKGVKVLAYRPPTTPEMLKVEADHSGFDETQFIRDFEAAGGTWVDVGQGYETYDGSHLTPDSTEKLSKRLAAAAQP